MKVNLQSESVKLPAQTTACTEGKCETKMKVNLQSERVKLPAQRVKV